MDSIHRLVPVFKAQMTPWIEKTSHYLGRATDYCKELKNPYLAAGIAAGFLTLVTGSAVYLLTRKKVCLVKKDRTTKVVENLLGQGQRQLDNKDHKPQRNDSQNGQSIEKKKKEIKIKQVNQEDNTSSQEIDHSSDGNDSSVNSDSNDNGSDYGDSDSAVKNVGKTTEINIEPSKPKAWYETWAPTQNALDNLNLTPELLATRNDSGHTLLWEFVADDYLLTGETNSDFLQEGVDLKDHECDPKCTFLALALKKALPGEIGEVFSLIATKKGGSVGHPS